MVSQHTLDESGSQICLFDALFALELCYRQQFAALRRASLKGLVKLRRHLSWSEQQLSSQIY